MSNRIDEAWWDLEGKKALVTGASRGIGRAIAESLGNLSAEVAVHYNNSAGAANEVVDAINKNGGRAFAVQADVTSSKQVAAMVNEVGQRWGLLDILVNNAGGMVERSSIEEISDDLIDKVIALNLESVIFATRAAIPLLRKAESACIVNVGSVSAHVGPANGAGLYGATKGAIHTLTRSLARELAPRIRVNAVAPGVIMTDFHRQHSSPRELEDIAASLPLKRLGDPLDVGRAVAFLCGKGALYLTGEVLEINGGRWFA